MDAIDADGFPVDFEQHLLNLLKEDAAAAADTSAKGPANVLANGLANVAANVFDREFTKAQQFEAGIYVPNSVESQGFNNVTGPVPSGAQFNQQQPATQLSIPQLPIPVDVSPRGESVDSLFDAPSSPGLRVTQTPSTSPEIPSVAMQIPISTPSKKKPKKNCTPRSKAGSITTEMGGHKILNSVYLPRALATAKEYSQHVSPFAPISPTRCVKTPQTANQLEKARRRIRDLTQERSHYQRALRQATVIDPHTGKTNLQIMQTQNATLKRVNSTQATTNKKLKEDCDIERKRYIELANRYNMMLQDFQRAQQENMELKARLQSS